MRKTVFLLISLLVCLNVSGCARNNVNDNTIATRNAADPTNLNNPNRNYGGPNVLNNYDTTPGPDRVGNNVMDRNGNTINDVNDNNRSKMRVADDAADKVANLPEVDMANVIVTENNAYVAAKLAGNKENNVSMDVKDKISKAVKSVDPDIDNVYVSSNPDFYRRINNYANDIRNGRPVSGFFNEFTKAVRRAFPDLK